MKISPDVLLDCPLFFFVKHLASSWSLDQDSFLPSSFARQIKMKYDDVKIISVTGAVSFSIADPKVGAGPSLHPFLQRINVSITIRENHCSPFPFLSDSSRIST